MPVSLARISVWHTSAVLCVLAASLQSASAQTSTEYVEEGGTLFRVTRQKVQRPVSKTEWDQQQQTVYHEQYDTQWQTNYRTTLTPVTEYRQELYLANRWNPLATPYWSYRYVPVLRWEARQEPYSIPLTQRSWVPEQRTVQIPRTTTEMVTDEHVSKVALGPVSGSGGVTASPPASMARRDTIGGIKKLE